MPRKLVDSYDRVISRIEKITETGCWIFLGALNEKGYGIVGNGGRGDGNDRAHRITYRKHKGDIPKGIFVCHICDVPACCNPDHLFLGTNKENHEDMVKKERHIYPPHKPGSLNGKSKLSEETAKYIKYSNQRPVALFNELGISLSTICNIKNGRTWKHI